MPDTKARPYKKWIVLLFVLIVATVTAGLMLLEFYKSGAYIAKTAAQADEGRDNITTAQHPTDAAPTSRTRQVEATGEPEADLSAADAFFADKMAGGGDDKRGEKRSDNVVAPNGIYSDFGTELLLAAGYDVGQKDLLVVSAEAAEKHGLSLAQQLAARTALYPNSPLAALSMEAILHNPGDNTGMAALSASVAGALISANQLLEESDELIAPLIAYVDRPRKPVYLTIDDGPSRLTRKFLDVLGSRGVKATFFVIGANAKKYPDLIRDMYDEGHSIANHSYTHNYDKLYQSSSALRSEIQRCDKAINDILGFSYNSRVFRFPGGSTYKTASKYRSEIKNIGYTYYDWNCLNGDAQIKDKSADGLYKYMLSTYKNQDEVILLMHDSDTKQTTIDMLDRAIDFFIENDYEFRTLG